LTSLAEPLPVVPAPVLAAGIGREAGKDAGDGAGTGIEGGCFTWLDSTREDGLGGRAEGAAVAGAAGDGTVEMFLEGGGSGFG
jgi:hypothetical protein